MNLDEQAIHFVKEYFDAIAHNAVNDAYEKADSSTSFAEFMETLFETMNRITSEHVAAEVLQLSPQAIENYNGGGGMEVEDVQDLIDNYDEEDFGLDDAE